MNILHKEMGYENYLGMLMKIPQKTSNHYPFLYSKNKNKLGVMKRKEQLYISKEEPPLG